MPARRTCRAGTGILAHGDSVAAVARAAADPCNRIGSAVMVAVAVEPVVADASRGWCKASSSSE